MAHRDTCVMLVSDDKYQLPLATADNLKELAAVTKMSYSAVARAAQNGKPIRLPKGKYPVEKGLVIKVDLSDE